MRRSRRVVVVSVYDVESPVGLLMDRTAVSQCYPKGDRRQVTDGQFFMINPSRRLILGLGVSPLGCAPDSYEVRASPYSLAFLSTLAYRWTNSCCLFTFYD
jgi:hypothetical protein